MSRLLDDPDEMGREDFQSLYDDMTKLTARHEKRQEIVDLYRKIYVATKRVDLDWEMAYLAMVRAMDKYDEGFMARSRDEYEEAMLAQDIMRELG